MELGEVSRCLSQEPLLPQLCTPSACLRGKMDVDFDAAARRFSKEQSSAKAMAKAKAEAKAKERAALAAKKAKWEADAAKRREEEAARQAEEAAKRDEDLERNRGIAYVQMLRPELSLAAKAKGIVRCADKIQLPRSASTELEYQNASKNGQFFFELSTPDGKTTHASILDFNAPDGTVGMPEEVLRCLGLATGTGDALVLPEVRPLVTVRYRALKRGTFARVQPVAAAFSSDVGDVKLTLERELQLRTTLSAGDELRVHEGGAAYALRIVELEPEGAASIIDTDLEVDVLPSVEYEEAMAAEAAKATARQAALEAAMEQRRQAEAKAALQAAAAARQAEAEALAAVEARTARRAAALVALPEQPPASNAEAVTVQVRCPDGTRCIHRFEVHASASAVFNLVEASAWEDCPVEFTLVAAYPRRVVTRAEVIADPSRSLGDVGLSGRQEALFIELDEPKGPGAAVESCDTPMDIA